jgi:hypothetical protein
MFKRKELTVEEYVAKAAAAFADAEEKVNAAYKAVQALPPLADEARELGLVGFLQSMRAKNDLRAAAGDVAGGLAKVFAVHREGTLIAQEKGVDLPAPRDGGGNR